jgi:hypothetical protein
VPSKSQSPLEIVAKQMIMNERNLNMYWTPAPPKWDLAPAHVKSVLFPEYHGAEYVADGYVVEKVEEEVCSSSSDSEEESIPPPAELQRYL